MVYRPVARRFKGGGVHNVMHVYGFSDYYNNYACIGHNCLLIEI